MVTRRHIGIVGAGLAGAACARTLARAGFSVTLFEAEKSPALGASGNPLAILHPLVSKDHNLASQWVDIGMATTLRWLDELAGLAREMGIGPLGASCGVLQMTADATELIHWSSQGAWIRPARFVQACLADAQAHGAHLMYQAHVISVSADGSLSVQTPEGTSLKQQFDAIVVCNAMDMNRLIPNVQLMLNAIRGTISTYQIPSGYSLPCVICADGYATPAIDGEMVVGASYERMTLDPNADVDLLGSMEAITPAEGEASFHPASNFDRLSTISRPLAALCAQSPARHRTSIRCATLDRMPHVGRVLDWAAPLTPNISQIHQMPRSERLWVLGGLGSRGLSSAALGAEVVTAQLLGAELPIPARLAAAVDPVRFALRSHQRRKIG